MTFFQLSRGLVRSLSIGLFLFYLPAVSIALDENVVESDLAGKLTELEQQLQSIDATMQSLSDEQKSVRNEIRELNVNRHQAREKVMENVGLIELKAEIEKKQKELSQLQADLNQRISKSSEYAEVDKKQHAALARDQQINQKTVHLSEERVKTQLAIQQVKKDLELKKQATNDKSEDSVAPSVEVLPNL